MAGESWKLRSHNRRRKEFDTSEVKKRISEVGKRIDELDEFVGRLKETYRLADLREANRLLREAPEGFDTYDPAKRIKENVVEWTAQVDVLRRQLRDIKWDPLGNKKIAIGSEISARDTSDQNTPCIVGELIRRRKLIYVAGSIVLCAAAAGAIWFATVHLRAFEDAKYSEWRQKATPNQYLKWYPFGRYRNEMNRMVDSLDYCYARRSNLLGAYRDYQKVHPNGEYVQQARSKIDSLDEANWSAISSREDNQSFIQYLQAFPSGRHVNEAWMHVAEVKRADSLAYCDAVREGSYGAHQRYLATHSNGMFEDQARRELGRCDEAAWMSARRANTSNAYRNYLALGETMLHREEARTLFNQRKEVERSLLPRRMTFEGPHEKQMIFNQPRAGDVVGYLTKGTVIRLLSRSSDGLWGKISLQDGTQGWIKLRLREGNGYVQLRDLED